MRPRSRQSIVVSVQVHIGGQTDVSAQLRCARFSIPEHFNSSASTVSRLRPFSRKGRRQRVLTPSCGRSFRKSDSHAKRQSQSQ